MKILYYNPAIKDLPANRISDYQSDMLFHGLRSLFGKDCVDYPYHWYMYTEEKREDSKNIWGKGFTLYHTLPKEDMDYPEIGNKNFDTIIIPIHHTQTQNSAVLIPVINGIKSKYSKSKIAVVDGWDRTDINSFLLDHCRSNKIPYFKRELVNEVDGVFPISFAFPKEKICQNPLPLSAKQYGIAPLIPVNQSIDPSYMSTYIYEDEESYYEMYQQSAFALTSKKGGWDTLRHYEIIANGCIPYFVDIKECPKNTLWNFPKKYCESILKWPNIIFNKKDGSCCWGETIRCWELHKDYPGYIKTNKYDMFDRLYNSWQRDFMMYLVNELTTEKLAEYVLGVINDYD